jgi:hypothetical protein
MTLLKRIAKLPLEAANMVAGGNARDVLRSVNNPLLRRAAAHPKTDSKIMKRIVKRYGTKEERRAFAKERRKTHVARAATLAGGVTALRHEYKKQ